MAKNIGVLAAVAFVLGTQGVTAATITPSRLNELMASTSQQAVGLETLRARDKEILEKLASSLAYRYSDLLAGSELVFTRLADSGSVFYRLDFVGLRNKDRARALCEILEMDRCIARIGDDRLTVLEVRGGANVAAIAVIEEEEKPFSFFGPELAPEPNPRAKEIETRVRAMLDPLSAFPEPRPDFAAIEAAKALAEAEVEAARLREEQEQAAREELERDQLTSAATSRSMEDAVQDHHSRMVPEDASAGMPIEAESPYPEDMGGQVPGDEAHAPEPPLPEPYEAQVDHGAAELGLPSEPEQWGEVPQSDRAMDPDMPYAPQDTEQLLEAPFIGEMEEEQASLGIAPMTRQAAFRDAGLVGHPAPLLRPAVEKAAHPAPMLRPAYVVHLASLVPLLRPIEQQVAFAPRSVADAIARASGRGYFELAATGNMSGLLGGSQKGMTGIFRMPTLESLDLSPKSVSAQTEVLLDEPIAPEAELSEDIFEVPEVEAVAATEASEASLEVPPKAPMPAPLLRDIALAEIEDAVSTAAPEARHMAPAPIMREVALAGLEPAAPKLADISGPQLRSVAVAAMEERAAQEAFRVASAFGAAAPKPLLRTTALAMITPKVTANIQVAEVITPPKMEAEPEVLTGAGDPQIARSAPRSMTAEEGARDLALAIQPDPAPATTLLAEADTTFSETMEIAQLGKVSFDDRFAQPSHVDFADGEMAGRLQKLPFKRPDFIKAAKSRELIARPIYEAGSPSQLAMTSWGDQPFEVAQVPGMLEQPEEPQVAPDAPFVMTEQKSDSLSRLDMMLEGVSSEPAEVTAPEPVEQPKAIERPGLTVGGGSDYETTLQSLRKLRPAATEAPQAPEAAPAIPSAPAAAPQPAVAQKRTETPGLSLPSAAQRPAARPIAPLPQQTAPVPSLEAPAQVAAPVAQDEPDTSAEMEARLAEMIREQERQRQVIAVMSEIMAQRDQAEDPEKPAATPETAKPEPKITRLVPEGSMQRRPAPRQELGGNKDLAAAKEQATYEAGFSDDRSPMAKAAHPQGQPSAVQLREQARAMDEAVYRGLRIELSYVDSRAAVHARVAELKKFFPAVMLEKGRFYGASIPEQPHRYLVGFAAESEKARDDLIWYLDQMGIPWAIRAEVD